MSRSRSPVSPFFFLSALCCVFIAAAAPGQTGDPRPAEGVTFDGCLRSAIANNPALLKTRESVKASQDRLFQAWAAFLPTASVNAGLTSLNEDPPAIDVAALMGPNPPSIQGNPLLQYAFRDNWSTAVKVGMPLLAGGRNLASLRLARDDLKLNREQARLVSIQLKQDVLKAYYGVVVNRTMKHLTSLTIDQLGRRAVSISNQVRAGASTELELMRTRVMRAAWSAKFAGVCRALDANLGRLASLTGLGRADLTFTNGSIPPVDSTGESLEAAKQRALESRPEIAIVRLSERISSSARRIKLAALLPQASVSWNSYGVSKKEHPSLASADWQSWWDFRLTASWEVFNLPRWAETLQAGHERAARSYEVRSVQDRIALEAEDAFNGLAEARSACEAATVNFELARLTAETARAGKRSGTITATEELESVLGETEARVQKLRAEYDLTVADAEYGRATGLEH